MCQEIKKNNRNNFRKPFGTLHFKVSAVIMKKERVTSEFATVLLQVFNCLCYNNTA